MKHLYFAILLVVLVFSVVFTLYFVFNKGLDMPQTSIDSFEKCVAAGNAVTESYPSQCRTKDGKIFTQEILPEDKNKIIPPGSGCNNLCGNGRCEEIVCMGTGCPCAETLSSCPNDCSEGELTVGRTGIIQGKINVGPICPVGLEGEICPIPPEAYTSRQAVVLKVDQKTEVTRKGINSDGEFRIELPFGRYYIYITNNGLNEFKYPVTVKIGMTTQIYLEVDTGIR